MTKEENALRMKQLRQLEKERVLSGRGLLECMVSSALMKNGTPVKTIGEIKNESAMIQRAEHITEIVCMVCGIDVDVMKSKERNPRKRKFYIPRQLTAYFIYKYTELTLKEIGKFLTAGRPYHHTTILNQVEKAKYYIDIQENLLFPKYEKCLYFFEAEYGELDYHEKQNQE